MLSISSFLYYHPRPHTFPRCFYHLGTGDLGTSFRRQMCTFSLILMTCAGEGSTYKDSTGNFSDLGQQKASSTVHCVPRIPAFVHRTHASFHCTVHLYVSSLYSSAEVSVRLVVSGCVSCARLGFGHLFGHMKQPRCHRRGGPRIPSAVLAIPKIRILTGTTCVSLAAKAHSLSRALGRGTGATR